MNAPNRFLFRKTKYPFDWPNYMKSTRNEMHSRSIDMCGVYTLYSCHVGFIHSHFLWYCGWCTVNVCLKGKHLTFDSLARPKRTVFVYESSVRCWLFLTINSVVPCRISIKHGHNLVYFVCNYSEFEWIVVETGVSSSMAGFVSFVDWGTIWHVHQTPFNSDDWTSGEPHRRGIHSVCVCF